MARKYKSTRSTRQSTKGKGFFHLEWEGMKEFQKELKRMDDITQPIIAEEFTKFGKLVEEGARALAPHDKGDLEDTINSDRAVTGRKEVSVEVGVGSAYGVYQHEKRLRKGTYDKYDRGAKFPDYYQDGYGARTRSKPKWRGLKPGRKFLERAVQRTEVDFDEMTDRILKRIMEGRR